MHHKFSFLLFTTSNSSQDIRIIQSYGSTQAFTCEVELNILHYKESWGHCCMTLKGWGRQVKMIHTEVFDSVSREWCGRYTNVRGKKGGDERG